MAWQARRVKGGTEGYRRQAASAITEVPVGRTYLAITVELVHGSYTDDFVPDRAASSSTTSRVLAAEVGHRG
jgi:hypothetical protein